MPYFKELTLIKYLVIPISTVNLQDHMLYSLYNFKIESLMLLIYAAVKFLHLNLINHKETKPIVLIFLYSVLMLLLMI